MDEFKKLYQTAFSQVGPSQQIRERVAALQGTVPTTQKHYVRRLSGVMTAAVVLAALLGCAAVTAVYGGSIQGFFSHYWKAVYDRPMSDGQAAVIDHLTQDISQSQTVGGVTVTVDSATVGDDTFFLLLRVEGQKFSKRYSYAFDEMSMTFSPDPVSEGGGGLGGFGFQYQGLDGDGSLLMMLDMNYAAAEVFVPDTSPLSVELTLTDLTQGNGRGTVLSEGVWSFTFSLDRSQIPAPIQIGDADALLYDFDKEEHISVPVHHLEVTNTGVRFQLPYRPGRAAELRPTVILKDGTEVHHGGGAGTATEDDEAVSYSFHWSVPVDLDEVSAIRLGLNSIEIPIP